MAKAKTKEAPAAAGSASEGISVTSAAEKGRWRAGRHFTREATVIALDQLTADQVEAIENDPELSSKRVTIEAPAETPAT